MLEESKLARKYLSRAQPKLMALLNVLLKTEIKVGYCRCL